MIQLKLSTGPEPAVILEACQLSLEEWLREKNNVGTWGGSMADLVQIADEICQGVSVLHRNNFVHGDISPSTVMVSTWPKTYPVSICISDKFVVCCSLLDQVRQ